MMHPNSTNPSPAPADYPNPAGAKISPLRSLLRSLLLGLILGAIQFAVVFQTINPPPHYASGTTLFRLRNLERLILEWKNIHGTFPTRADLAKDNILTDAWQNEIVYLPSADSFELYSLGGDGFPGGRGNGTDLYPDDRNRRERRLTLSEFLASAAGKPAGILSLGTTILCAGFCCAIARHPLQRSGRLNLLELVMEIAITLAVTSILIVFHLSAAGSGH